MAAPNSAASAHGGSGLANVTGLLLRVRGDRLEVLRDAIAVGVGHTLAAAGAQAIARHRAREAGGDVGLGALQRSGDVGGEGLPGGVVLLERLGARRRAAPLVLFRSGHASARLRRAALHAVHQFARSLQFLVVGLLELLQIAAGVTSRAARP